jgi:hypothetical protein
MLFFQKCMKAKKDFLKKFFTCVSALRNKTTRALLSSLKKEI